MQAVEISCFVTKHQRRRQVLFCVPTSFQEGFQRLGISAFLLKSFGPSISDLRELRIELLAEFLHQRRQRIGEVLVLASTEIVSLHNNSAAKRFLVVVESYESLAFSGSEQRTGECI